MACFAQNQHQEHIQQIHRRGKQDCLDQIHNGWWDFPQDFLVLTLAGVWPQHQEAYSWWQFSFSFYRYFCWYSIKADSMISQEFYMVQSYRDSAGDDETCLGPMACLAVDIIPLVLNFGVRGRNALGISRGKALGFRLLSCSCIGVRLFMGVFTRVESGRTNGGLKHHE